MLASKEHYLEALCRDLEKVWPDNQTVAIVCHGHSCPAGYTANHVTRPLDAYPHLIRQELSLRFPCSVVNVIVTAIGGEGAISGARRFKRDVLGLKPRLVTLDYGLNDRFGERAQVEAAWRQMIEEALKEEVKVVLVTPLPDCGGLYYDPEKLLFPASEISEMLRRLAKEYGIGLADAAAAFELKQREGLRPGDILISANHPNRRGHEILSGEIMDWFPL